MNPAVLNPCRSAKAASSSSPSSLTAASAYPMQVGSGVSEELCVSALPLHRAMVAMRLGDNGFPISVAGSQPRLASSSGKRATAYLDSSSTARPRIQLLVHMQLAASCRNSDGSKRQCRLRVRRLLDEEVSPWDRRARRGEIQKALAFLVGEGSGSVSGQAIEIDGGRTWLPA